MRTLFCVRPPRVGSLFPSVLSESCNQFPLGFKVWFSMNSSSRCRTPRLGSLMWGSEPSLQGVDFCGISVRQSVSHPPTSYGIWFYSNCAPPTVSLWLLRCLWMWGIFFGEFQCLPVNDCPAASCDYSVLARGSESTSFYSAILVPSLPCCFDYYLFLCTLLSQIWQDSAIGLNIAFTIGDQARSHVWYSFSALFCFAYKKKLVKNLIESGMQKLVLLRHGFSILELLELPELNVASVLTCKKGPWNSGLQREALMLFEGPVLRRRVSEDMLLQCFTHFIL